MKTIDLTKLKSLEELIYKTVKITTTDDKIFEGDISSYTRADDAIDGLENIGIEMDGYIECFDRTMIKSIEEFDAVENETEHAETVGKARKLGKPIRSPV